MSMGGGARRPRLDDSITRQKVRPDTVRRILPYARKYRWVLALLLFVTALDAAINVANPLLLGTIIDRAILPHDLKVLIELSVAIAVLGLLDAAANYLQAWSSSTIGQGVVLNLRTQVFRHVQQQPLAFFTRSQTGSLVSRLNTDVIGAQQAVTTLLSQTLSMVLTLALTLSALFALSWRITVIALVVIPLFMIPGKLIGGRLQRLTREGMQLDAELGSMMNERFNVDGAMLSKLYGRPGEEASVFGRRAGRVRDIAVMTSVYGKWLGIAMSLVAVLMSALVYGLGGTLVISGSFKIGTLVAMAALIGRLYGPINQLTNMQVNFLIALVSFDRVFEVLDLKPLITDRPGALALQAGGTGNGSAGTGSGSAPQVEFEQVTLPVSGQERDITRLTGVDRPADARTHRRRMGPA